jgi:hypothetical protein
MKEMMPKGANRLLGVITVCHSITQTRSARTGPGRRSRYAVSAVVQAVKSRKKSAGRSIDGMAEAQNVPSKSLDVTT